MKLKKLLILLSLLTLSLVTYAEEKPQGEPPKMESQNKLTKEQFYAKLNLSTEQKQKLDVILSDFEKSMKKEPPKNDNSSTKPIMDNDSMKKEMDEKMTELSNKAKAILNKTQYENFEKNLKDYLLPPGPPPQNK